jgi:hypothetical protein
MMDYVEEVMEESESMNVKNDAIQVIIYLSILFFLNPFSSINILIHSIVLLDINYQDFSKLLLEQLQETFPEQTDFYKQYQSSKSKTTNGY